MWLVVLTINDMKEMEKLREYAPQELVPYYGVQCTLENGNDKIDAFRVDYANNGGAYLYKKWNIHFVTNISVFAYAGTRFPFHSLYKHVATDFLRHKQVTLHKVEKEGDKTRIKRLWRLSELLAIGQYLVFPQKKRKVCQKNWKQWKSLTSLLILFRCYLLIFLSPGTEQTICENCNRTV